MIFAQFACFFSVSENEHLKLCIFLFSQIVLVVVLVVYSWVLGLGC